VFYKLESLRGVAACLVVLFHSNFMYGEKSLSFVSNSYLFVDFFFVLSGFVMSIAYSPRIMSGLSFKEFLILRLGRVYPLHIAMLLAWVPYIIVKQYLFESGFGGTDPLEKNNVYSFVSNVFLLNSLGLHDYLSWNVPAWSISTEFFAYVFFYLFTLFVDRKDSMITPLVIAIICYAIIISLGRNNLDITYDFGLLRCLGAFYIGVFVCRVKNKFSCPLFIKEKMAALEILCLTAIVFLVSIAGLNLLYFIPIIIVFSFSIYLFSQEQNGFFGRLLLTGIFRKVGLWSYSIYMVHLLVIAGASNVFEYILHWNLNSSLGSVSFAINLCLLITVVLISKCTYSLIELPFRERSRKLTNKYNKSMQQSAKAAAD
jgi:peptidoglycan/LPS O-acetylase OafA/YrhL